MAETMLERAAKAATDRMGDCCDGDAVTIARAVIASLREPSDDVAMAGVMHDYSLCSAWRAMIDAILEEPKA